MSLPNACEQHVDRESCDRTGCQWIFDAEDQEGKCIMRPDAFLRATEISPFDFGDFAALSTPAMAAFTDILHAVLPSHQMLPNAHAQPVLSSMQEVSSVSTWHSCTAP